MRQTFQYQGGGHVFIGAHSMSEGVRERALILLDTEYLLGIAY